MGERLTAHRGGKTRAMVEWAAAYLSAGKTVAYATMSEANAADFALDVHAKCGHLPSILLPPTPEAHDGDE